MATHSSILAWRTPWAVMYDTVSKTFPFILTQRTIGLGISEEMASESMNDNKEASV